MEQLNRRRFLGAAAGTGAAASLGAFAPSAFGKRASTTQQQGGDYRGRLNVSDIAIQLYTLRDIMGDQREARRVLRALGGIGYRNVELAGYYGWNARQLKRQLDNAGLRAVSSHDDPLASGGAAIRDDYEEIVEGMVELDQEYTGLAYYNSSNIADWHRLAGLLNEAGEITQRHGIQFFYHNHAQEFQIRDESGKRVFDILLDETDRNLVKFELDLYWILDGGGNPLAYLSEDPERYPLYHVKDRTWEDRPDDEDWEDVGPGSIDWEDIFAAGAQRRLKKYYVIEHDNPFLSHPDEADAPLITAQVGFDYLSNVRF